MIILKLEDQTIELNTHEVEGKILYKAQDLLKGYGLNSKQSSKKLENWGYHTNHHRTGVVKLEGRGGGTFLTKYLLLSLATYANIPLIVDGNLIDLPTSHKIYAQREYGALCIIEQILGIKLLRQYRVGNYRVDGYDKINNVVYEIDEGHHKYQEEEDKKRQAFIEKTLHCTFKRFDVS